MDRFKAKILSSIYDQGKDLIIWTLLNMENSQQQSYCWPAKEYLSKILGVSELKIDLPFDVIHSHCDSMKGKEINFEIHGDLIEVEPKTDTSKEKYADNIVNPLIEKEFEELHKSVSKVAKEKFGIDINEK